MNFLAAIALLMFTCLSYSQQAVLRIPYGVISNKNCEVFNGDYLEYKLKGDKKFRKKKIVAMKDSAIVFDDESEIKLMQLKSVRFRRDNHLIRAFQAFFVRAGILFIILDTANNLILERPQIVNKKAVIISLGLFSAYLVFKRAEIKTIRVKNKTLKIIEMSYQM